MASFREPSLFVFALLCGAAFHSAAGQPSWPKPDFSNYLTEAMRPFDSIFANLFPEGKMIFPTMGQPEEGVAKLNTGDDRCTYEIEIPKGQFEIFSVKGYDPHEENLGTVTISLNHKASDKTETEDKLKVNASSQGDEMSMTFSVASYCSPIKDIEVEGNPKSDGGAIIKINIPLKKDFEGEISEGEQEVPVSISRRKYYLRRETVRERKTTEDQPTGTEDQPTGTEDQPTGTEEKPTGTEEKPIGTEEKPIGTEEKPIGTEEKPIETQETDDSVYKSSYLSHESFSSSSSSVMGLVKLSGNPVFEGKYRLDNGQYVRDDSTN